MLLGMKRLLLIALLLVGCGQTCEDPDLTNNPIIWQGTADQYETDVLTKAIQQTIYCLNSFDPNLVKRTGSPLIVVTGDEVFSGQGYYNGCNTIYVQQEYLVYDHAASNGVYYPYVFAGSIFRHEIIHWAVDIDNSLHQLEYLSCENQIHS